MYESSLGDEASLRSSLPSNPSEHELQEAAAEGCRAILDRMVDPAIEMCVVTSEEKHKSRPSWDREVFVINTMTYLQVSIVCM